MQAPQVPSTSIACQHLQPNQLIQKKAKFFQPSDTLLQGPTQLGHIQQGHHQNGQFQQGQLQQDHIHQPYPSGTASLVDQDDDYCKTYAVLVDDLKNLLGQLGAGPSTPELQLELHNQTRAAVSSCNPFSNGSGFPRCCLHWKHLVLCCFVPAAMPWLSQDGWSQLPRKLPTCASAVNSKAIGKGSCAL